MQSLQLFPYQGSKRRIADIILRYFPQDFDTLIEPFAGSAAVSIAAAVNEKASKFHINDINESLIALWYDIINDPDGLAERYEKLWRNQRGRERAFYDEIRDIFNCTHSTDSFLYLLARCVKGAVRYNSDGKFNQSPDNRRLGRRPEQMRSAIMAASKLFLGKITLSSEDYREVLSCVNVDDLVYIDPPYQGVCRGQDSRYLKGVKTNAFIHELSELSRRGIAYLVSYDGRYGDKIYGPELPSSIGVYRVEVAVGRSSQATLLGKEVITYESLYLSEALIERLELSRTEIVNSIVMNGIQ